MKTRMSFSLAIAFAFALMVGGAQAQLVTIADADFESNPGGWNTFGNAFQEEASTDVTGKPNDPGIGSETLKMFGNFSGSPNFTGAFQDIAVDGTTISVGDLVQMSAWGITVAGDSITGGPNNAFIEITYVDGAGNEFGFGGASSADLNSVVEDEWVQLFTPGSFVPAAASSVRVKAVFVNNDNAGGAAWIDNVEFRKIDPVPEPTSAGLIGLGLMGLILKRRRNA